MACGLSIKYAQMILCYESHPAEMAQCFIPSVSSTWFCHIRRMADVQILSLLSRQLPHPPLIRYYNCMVGLRSNCQRYACQKEQDNASSDRECCCRWLVYRTPRVVKVLPWWERKAAGRALIFLSPNIVPEDQRQERT